MSVWQLFPSGLTSRIAELNLETEDFIQSSFVQPIEDILRDIRIAGEALDFLADHLPAPEPKGKTQVCTVYDIQVLLNEIRRDKLKTLIHNRAERFKQVLQTAFNKEARKLIFNLIIRLRWAKVFVFILHHIGSLAVTTLGAEELYTLMKTEISDKIPFLALGQTNPRVLEKGKHYHRSRTRRRRKKKKIVR